VKKLLQNWFIVVAALALVALVVVFSREPRGVGNWIDEFIRTPLAHEDSDGMMHIENIRDWTYAKGAVLSRDWIDEVVVAPNQITRAWFMEEPFPSWSAVGHTYLSFEFEDKTVISFSVEARMQKGEKYSALKGLFRQYELTYSWGTERDFLARRILLLGHSVRMYPLTITTEGAQKLFRALAEKTSELAASPRFYNSLTANCTNILAGIVNETFPKKIPYDISWNFPGSSDIFLMKKGFIAAGGSPEESRVKHDLAQYRDEIEAVATSDQKNFSAKIRELLETATSSQP
jgi:hypothetical protein